MSLPSQLQPRQILCLEHRQWHLYVEVIQMVHERPVCWMRPMVLVEQDEQTSENQPKIYDLRLSSDLLMPPQLFRPAIDTEIIPLLAKVQETSFDLEAAQAAHQVLCALIQKVCQGEQQNFTF